MTQIPIKKYAFRLLVFSVVVAGLTLPVQLLIPQYSSPALPFIVLFFFVITLLSLYIVLRKESRQQDKKFISSYLLSRLIKFFSCLVFLVLYILLCPKDRWLFAISFIIIYFLFSVFEVVILKKENKK